jgi:DNA invertase Pin-like site-specific DNA recombinase
MTSTILGVEGFALGIIPKETNMMRSKKVALYARTSTPDQDVGLQLDELRQAAAERGWSVIGEYVDEGVSGSKAKRPALDRMMKDAEKGRFDLVAVWKLDRLGRSLKHLLKIVESLGSWDVGFMSLRDAGIDTTTPTGRLMLQVLGALAEYERELIRERVIAGIRRAQAQGKHCGRPRQDLDLRAAHLLLAQGHSVRQVADMLGQPRSTLRARLWEAAAQPDEGGQEGVEQEVAP